VNWKPLLGLASVGVGALLDSRFAMRAKRETDPSFGSLFVLRERARPSERGGGGTASPAAPDGGSSVCMKQQRLP
jgi:hypothetical protein